METTKLQVEDRKKLLALIQEAKSRGLPVEDLLKKRIEQQQQSLKDWETSENGYFLKQDGTIFRPYKASEDFILSLSRFVGFFGGRGSSKSASGAQKALKKVSKGLSGAVLNPTFENFTDSTWPEFRNWIPWNHVIPQHQYRKEPSWKPQRPFILAFDTGATVICKGLHDPSAARGPNINWLWFDEAQDDEDGMSWKIAIASVRVGKNPQAWATATGRGKYHWLYNFFVEQQFPEDVYEAIKKIQDSLGSSDIPLIDFFTGTIEDNKANLDPMFYASMLATYPVGYLREQELHGAFVDPGGNLGDVSWFNGKILLNSPEVVKKRVRYWDLAATEKKIAGKKLNDPDETVGTLLSWIHDNEDKKGERDEFVVEDQISGQLKWDEIKERIKSVAEVDGPFVPIYIEQEPGSGGINQIAEIKSYLKKELPGWSVYENKPQGDKVVRANIWFAEAAQGKFYLVRGAWNDSFLKQLSSFPSGKHDDKIDSVSGARVVCAPINKWKKVEFMHLGMRKDDKSANENKV